MEVDDFILISVDDHLIEPPDVFLDHLPAKYQARAPEELSRVFAESNVPDDHIAKITHENAMRWYSFDPFKHVKKDEATVGALRRQAEGHDVSVMSRSKRVRTPDEKLAGFRARAERAMAMSKS